MVIVIKFGHQLSNMIKSEEISVNTVPDLFVELNKMIELGGGSIRQVEDIVLKCEKISQIFKKNF